MSNIFDRFDEPIEDDPPPVGLGGDSDSDGSSDEPIDYEDDILEDEVNGRDYIVNKKNGKLWDDDMNEVGTADFEGDKITKIYLNKDKTKEQIKLKNEEAKKVAFEDALSSGLLDKEPEIKEIDLDDFDPDDFVEIEFEDMDYLINDEVEEPHPVYSMTGKYVGKWVENLGIVFENKEAEKWHESQQSPRKDPVMTPGLSADIEDQKPPSPVPESEEELSSESDIESSESDIESSDEDSDDSEIEGLWRVQIDYVDLIVGEVKQYESDFNPKNEEEGFKYSLTDTEAEYLGFFKDWKEKDNQPINWNDLKGFEWFSKEAKANYIEQRNELLDDEGIDTDRYSIPQRIRSLQIGGMTKGHFHKEVPVILHGGELVIPKKHVSQVMAQSELAKQISKIPPTWQKIKEIIK